MTVWTVSNNGRVAIVCDSEEKAQEFAATLMMIGGFKSTELTIQECEVQ